VLAQRAASEGPRWTRAGEAQSAPIPEETTSELGRIIFVVRRTQLRIDLVTRIPLCLAILLSLRQVHDGGFCVFCGYVSMASFPMLNGFFQMCDPFAHMRMIRASLQGMLQRGFGMCQECLSMTLFAMVHRFFRVLEGVLEVLLFLTHNVTPRPTLAEYRLQRQHCGGD
jgi:hypothetical protein